MKTTLTLPKTLAFISAFLCSQSAYSMGQDTKRNVQKYQSKEFTPHHFGKAIKKKDQEVTQELLDGQQKAKTRQEKRRANSKIHKRQRKTYSHMNLAELTVARQKLLDAQSTCKTTYMRDSYNDAIISYTERMLKLSDSINEIAQLMIQLSDLSFDTGKLEKAATLYKEFTRLYPGNPKAEYAHYKGLLCTFYGILDAERDQSKTHDAIELADSFLNRDGFSEYKDQVIGIQKQCYQRLIESELNICDFYKNRKDYNAVAHRLENIRSTYIAHAPMMEMQLLNYEFALASAQNKTEMIEQKQVELAQLQSDKDRLLAQAEKPSKWFWEKL